ncbi:hypothetical protein D3C81_589560 [compost metagenome]
MENPRGTIALVNIAVEDQHLVHATGFQQVMADDGQVVEDTKAGWVVIVRMMSATGQVTGDAMFQGLFRRQQGAAHCAHRTSGQCFAPG